MRTADADVLLTTVDALNDASWTVGEAAMRALEGLRVCGDEEAPRFAAAMGDLNLAPWVGNSLLIYVDEKCARSDWTAPSLLVAALDELLVRGGVGLVEAALVTKALRLRGRVAWG